MQAKAPTTERSPILTRRFDSNPRAPTPLGTEASYMHTKAIMIEPSPILTRQFDSIPKAPSPLRTGVTLI